MEQEKEKDPTALEADICRLAEMLQMDADVIRSMVGSRVRELLLL